MLFLLFWCLSWKCETLPVLFYHYFYPFVVTHQRSFIQGIQGFKLFASKYVIEVCNLCRYETSENDDYSLEWVRGTRGRAEFLSKSPPKGKMWNSPKSGSKATMWNNPKRTSWSDSPVRGMSFQSCWYVIMYTACYWPSKILSTKIWVVCLFLPENYAYWM